MKVVKILGSLLYGSIMYYLLWLLFCWITPFVMGIGWVLFILYLIIAGGFLTLLIAQISSWIGIPLVLICNNCKPAKYVQLIPGILFGIYSVRLPWVQDMDYGILQWIIGIFLTITILITFISILTVSFKVDKEME